MRMQVKAPVVCAGAHASLRVQRARPMRLSAFQGFVAPTRLSANCNLFATQQSFASLTNAQIRSPSSRSLRTVVCMAAKKSVSDLKKADLEGKVVLVRADLNVPLDKSQKITDDTRIRAAIPTLKYLTDNGAKVLLTSHLVSALPAPRCPDQHIGPQFCTCRVGSTERWSRRQVSVDTCCAPPVGIARHQGRPKDKFGLIRGAAAGLR